MARARHWGWPNTYTYSKALGEQAIAKSGCKSAIVRPAIVESALPSATIVDAAYAGEWRLPVIGRVSAPAAVLIRPDGHVAWVGDGTPLGLTDALATWFGPPTAR